MEREPHSLNCCCCRTTTAAKIVGWLDVIGSIIFFVWYLISFAWWDKHGGVYAYADTVQTINIIIIIISLGLLVTAIILLVGIGRKSAPLCLPYIIYKALQIIASVGLIIWYAIEIDSFLFFAMFWVFGILWDIYQLATAAHCFAYLNGLDSQTGFTRQQQVVPMQPAGAGYGGYGQQQVQPGYWQQQVQPGYWQQQVQQENGLRPLYGNAYGGFGYPGGIAG